MKLQSAVFYTRDLDAAEKFYDALGLKTNVKIPDILLSLSFPDGGQLDIKQAKGEREMPGFQTVHVDVPDAEGLHQFVSSLGVHLRDNVRPHPNGGKYFVVSDPDLNTLVFIQPAAPVGSERA